MSIFKFPKKKILKSTPAQRRASRNYYLKHSKEKIAKTLFNRQKNHPWRAFKGHFDIVYAGLVKTAKKHKLEIYPKDKFWEETTADYTHAYNCWKHFNFHPALTPIFDLNSSAWTGRWWMHRKMIHPNTGIWDYALRCEKPGVGLDFELVFKGNNEEVEEAYYHSVDMYDGESCDDQNCRFVAMLRPMEDVEKLIIESVDESS